MDDLRFLNDVHDLEIFGYNYLDIIVWIYIYNVLYNVFAIFLIMFIIM